MPNPEKHRLHKPRYFSSQQLSDSTCHGIAVQLLAALEHIHGFRVIHRDVKPANVLVSFGEPLKTCRLT